MTISESLVKWILSLPIDIRIETDSVGAGSDRFGLYRMPQRNVENHIDGGQVITEYYQLLCRQSSKTNTDRKSTDKWLEDFIYTVDDEAYYGDLPKLGKNRRCLNVEATGSPYVMAADTDTNLYQIQLSITYERERS